MTSAAAALALFIAGYYEPTSSSEPSICPQFVRRVSPTAISVVYVGDCGWQGPFTYDCFSSVCLSSDSQVSFEWTNERQYRWNNRAYAGYQADFEWVAPRPPETR